jgi:thioredoxin 1
MEKIHQKDFEDKLKSSEYVIIDFSSPGCAPCKRVPPLLEEIIAEPGDLDLSAYEVDIVEDMSIAQKHFVLGVPTIIIFKEGKEIRRFNSVPKKEKIIKALK